MPSIDAGVWPADELELGSCKTTVEWEGCICLMACSLVLLGMGLTSVRCPCSTEEWYPRPTCCWYCSIEPGLRGDNDDLSAENWTSIDAASSCVNGVPRRLGNNEAGSRSVGGGAMDCRGRERPESGGDIGKSR